MARSRNDGAAASAAALASEAARVLQERSQQRKAEPPAPQPESRKEEVPVDPAKIESARKNTPHRKGMEEVLARRKEQEELDQPKAEEKKEEKPAPKVEKAEAKPAAPATEAQEKPAEPKAEEVKAEAPAAPEAPKTIRVKVDGEEFDVPAEDVEAAGGVRAYQTGRAAENRLRKTSELVERLQRSLATQPPAQPQPPQKSDVDFIAEKMDVVRFGTPAEAAAALLEIQNRGKQQVDPNQIINQAVGAMQRQQAVVEFGKEYQDIVSSPLLVKLAVQLENEELAAAHKAGQRVDWKNLYSKIGTQLRSLVPARQSQPTASATTTPGNTSQPSAKEERKASITNLPTSAARAKLPEEEKQLTPDEARAEAIRDMKKSRGQHAG